MRLQDFLIINISGWEQTNILDFLHGDSNQQVVVFKTITAGWVWPGMSSYPKT